jgi:hypothetical protein
VSDWVASWIGEAPSISLFVWVLVSLFFLTSGKGMGSHPFAFQTWGVLSCLGLAFVYVQRGDDFGPVMLVLVLVGIAADAVKLRRRRRAGHSETTGQ